MREKERRPARDIYGEFVAPPSKEIKNVPSDIYGEFAVPVGRKGSVEERREHREGGMRARERRRRLPLEFLI